MKETGKGTVLFLWALWLIFTICALPAMAAESEIVMAEGISAQQTGQLEWFALLFSSIWALILQIFRLRK